MSCADELRGLGDVRDTIKAKGGEVVAICLQPLERITEGRKENPTLPAFLACDPDGVAVRKLNLENKTFGKVGKSLAIPANILIDPKGIVQWLHYSELVSDRPDPKLVLNKVLQFGSNAGVFGMK